MDNALNVDDLRNKFKQMLYKTNLNVDFDINTNNGNSMNDTASSNAINNSCNYQLFKVINTG